MSPSTAARASVTHLGPPRGAPALPDAVVAIAQALTEAGLPTEALDSADRVIWTKLALAGPMGPLSALLRRGVSDVADNPHSHALLRAMFDEIVDVATEAGVALDRDAVWAHALETFAGVGPHTTSMAADVLAGRRTEIDAFCGEVTRLGVELGVATPVNRTVWHAVEAIEQTYAAALST
jgi:2-dehydropantoate 2-reductase